MDHAVEDGVRKRRDPDHVMPPINWNLACDDQGSLVVAVLDDFQKVAGLIRRQGLRSPVIKDQEFGACKGAQHPAIARIPVGQCEVSEEPWHAYIENRYVLPAGLLPKRASQPAFAKSGGAGDEEIAPLGDPIAGPEFEEQGAVEAA